MMWKLFQVESYGARSSDISFGLGRTGDRLLVEGVVMSGSPSFISKDENLARARIGPARTTSGAEMMEWICIWNLIPNGN